VGQLARGLRFGGFVIACKPPNPHLGPSGFPRMGMKRIHISRYKGDAYRDDVTQHNYEKRRTTKVQTMWPSARKDIPQCGNEFNQILYRCILMIKMHTNFAARYFDGMRYWNYYSCVIKKKCKCMIYYIFNDRYKSLLLLIILYFPWIYCALFYTWTMQEFKFSKYTFVSFLFGSKSPSSLRNLEQIQAPRFVRLAESLMTAAS